MDPPTSPRSSEYQRDANDCVVRDGVLFRKSPFLGSGPGPGSYSPRTFSNNHRRGITAKPSSGPTGRQAWDLRGSEGGAPLIYLRGGQTVSPSMGNSPRMADFSRVALRDGVLLLRGAEDGHRSKGIGPGTYDGFSNREDSMSMRSYNVRAKCSRTLRKRSYSFSGTSSTARAYLFLQPSRSPQGTVDSRTDYLQLLDSRMQPGGVPPASPTRPISPASVMLTSMRARQASPTALGGKSGKRGRARSASPKRIRKCSPSPTPGFQGLTCHTWGSVQHLPGPQVSNHPIERASRSMSPPPLKKEYVCSQVTRASSISPRTQEARQSELSSPRGGRRVKSGTPTHVRSKGSPTARDCVGESFCHGDVRPAGQNDTRRRLQAVASTPSLPTANDEPSETVDRSEAAGATMEKQDLVELEKIAVALEEKRQTTLKPLVLPKQVVRRGVSTLPGKSVKGPHEQQQHSDTGL